MAKPRNAQDRLAQKNRRKKVDRWNEFSRYKKVLQREGLARTGEGAAASQTSTEHADGEAQAESTGTWRRKKRKGHSAQVGARQQWEKGQADADAEWEAKRAAAEERERQRAEAQKRRAVQTALLKKRTKRGQPVLGNQVELLLGRIMSKS
jgi:hypothetical protein